MFTLCKHFCFKIFHKTLVNNRLCLFNRILYGFILLFHFYICSPLIKWKNGPSHMPPKITSKSVELS